MELTRRQIITGAGAIAAASAVGAVGGSSVVKSAMAAEEKGYPYGYKKMDPQKAAEIAYENWYTNFCAYGTLSGIVVPQRKLVGGGWNDFPMMSVKFGEGGIEGWGTICGTLLGANVAISLAAGHEGKPIINDMMNYYSVTEMPTFMPKQPKAQFKSKTTSDSPLCHISVGKWMAAERKGLSSPERRDRCARLAASVAFQTAVLLNAWADGTYKPSYTGKQAACGITSQNNCTDCHGNNVPTPI